MTRNIAIEAINLAESKLPLAGEMKSSAEINLKDAKRIFNNGNAPSAKKSAAMWALSSLAYSVGTFNDEYIKLRDDIDKMFVILPFHSDPSHGWLEVPRSELESRGLLERVSHYSYEEWDGSKIYLEEDCDASIYLDALKAEGIDVEFNELYAENSFIRNLPSFSLHS